MAYRCIAKARSGVNRPHMTVLRKVFTFSATFTANLSFGFQCTRGIFCDPSYCRGQLRELGLPDCMPIQHVNPKPTFWSWHVPVVIVHGSNQRILLNKGCQILGCKYPKHKDKERSEAAAKLDHMNKLFEARGQNS